MHTARQLKSDLETAAKEQNTDPEVANVTTVARAIGPMAIHAELLVVVTRPVDAVRIAL